MIFRKMHLMICFPAALASAAAFAAPPFHDTFTMFGGEAIADFTSFTPGSSPDCGTSRDVLVFGDENAIKVGGTTSTPDTMGSVAVITYDSCSNQILLNAQGSFFGVDFVQDGTNAAYLNFSGTLHDFVSGSDLPLVLSLVWQGDGSHGNLKTQYHFQYENLLVNSTGNGLESVASVSGSVLVNGVEALASLDTVNASLSMTHTHEVDIFRF